MVWHASTKQNTFHKWFLIEICLSNVRTMHNVCCKYSAIANLTPHYTLSKVDWTMPRSIVCGSEVVTPEDRRGLWIGAPQPPRPLRRPHHNSWKQQSKSNTHTQTVKFYICEKHMSCGTFLGICAAGRGGGGVHGVGDPDHF